MTHTPGPWHIEERSHGISVKAGERLVCFTTWSRYTTDMGMSLAERLANMRLIAAVPDLLALAHQYASDLRHPPSADSVERRLERIAAVLAKVGA